MSYLTHHFEEARVGDFLATGGAGIEYASDGSWTIHEIVVSAVFDGDGEMLDDGAVLKSDVKATLIRERSDEIHADVLDALDAYDDAADRGDFEYHYGRD